jgi:hypothetical protein
MAQNKILNVPPVALAAAAANILTPGTATGAVGFTGTNPYIIIKHIRAVNNDAVAHTLKLFKGATGGSAVGTELAYSGTQVPANSYVDLYGQIRLDSADFLTGFADVASKLTLNIDAEIGLA